MKSMSTAADVFIAFWAAIIDDIDGKKKASQADEGRRFVGKFRGHARQNNVGMADSAFILPETVRNRKRAEQVDAYLKSHGGTRRHARNATRR